MEGIFSGLYIFLSKHKFLFWGILIAICFPVFFFAAKINLEEDITKVLPGSDSQEYQQVLKQSGIMEKLVFRITLSDSSQSDPDKLTSYASAFIRQIENKKDLQPLIKDIRDRIPDEVMFKAYKLFYNNLPFFLEEQDYKKIDTMLTDTSIARSMQKNYHTLMSPMSMVAKVQIKTDPLHLTTLALSKLQSLQINQEYELYDGYIVSRDRKSLLLIITPAYPPNETIYNAKLIEGLDEIIKNSSQEFKDVHTEYFGAMAVAVANAKQIHKDIALTISLAIISIFVLLWWYFRKASLPLVLLLPITFGTAFALAFIYLYKQSISGIALGGGAVIIGIAVDYSLHVFTHYKHTRSIKIVIKDLSTPLLVGNISTVGAFLSLLFVKSEVLFDFGLFAGLSLFGAIIFTLVFLPHFLAFYTLNTSVREHTLTDHVGERIISYTKANYKYFIFLIFIISLVFLFTSQNVRFENDLNSLNFMPPELKKAEENLRVKGHESERMIYLLFNGKNLNEALVRNEIALKKINDLQKVKAVYKYFGVNAVIVSDSMQKLRKERWKNYWTQEKKERLKSNIEKFGPAYGFKKGAFNDFFELFNKDFISLSSSEIEEVKEYFLKDYISSQSDGKVVLMACLQIPSSQSTKVYETLAFEKGLYILDKQYLIKKFISILEADFNQILYSASLLVFAILLIFYGRIELAFIAFFPMLVSWIWILGFMDIFNFHFNIVNIIISTFIFGLGDDYSIFMMDGLLGEHKNGTKNLPSYKASIMLSALTTLFGMGVLIFAQHPALKSIALISVVGIACVLFISYTLIPLLFGFFISNRVKKGIAPLTLYSFIKTIITFSFFLVGCISLTIIGFIIFKIFRLKGGRPKLFYHYLIMYFARFLVSFSKNKSINVSGENFSKPAIIVANHQSLLDILMLLCVHPKIVLLTKDWVWNSIFMGPVVRMAGFLTSSKGIENNYEMARETIKMGYSIAIFPEGSRSEDLEIKRFHKGAFFLAEQLKLDIIPIVIHGTGNKMPKKDIFLQPFPLLLNILGRIEFNNIGYGSNYQDKTKEICRLMREEYNKVKREFETPRFFYQKLVQKYIYKGPELEWYMRIKLKLEKYYKTMDELIPVRGRIYDVGCGYGFSSYMLGFLSKDREIVGIDFDEKKIEVAAHCQSDTSNVSFYSADALKYNYEKADSFIISDVLHYMSKESQRALIAICIDKLNPGGVLIIRDADASLQKRHRGTRISELFSVKLLGFNKSDNKQLHFISSQDMFEILKSFDVQVKIIDQTKLNSNIIYHIQKPVR
jgi:1-acyl-sn-glycerol-3-phosphate acyltransferase